MRYARAGLALGVLLVVGCAATSTPERGRVTKRPGLLVSEKHREFALAAIAEHMADRGYDAHIETWSVTCEKGLGFLESMNYEGANGRKVITFFALPEPDPIWISVDLEILTDVGEDTHSFDLSRSLPALDEIHEVLQLVGVELTALDAEAP